MEVAITAVAVIDLIFVIIIYYAFYLLTVYTIVDTLLPYYMYMQSGNIQYANSLLIDFVINLATLEIGKLLRGNRTGHATDEQMKILEEGHWLAK